MATSKTSIAVGSLPHQAGLARTNTSMSKRQCRIYWLQLTSKHAKKARRSHADAAEAQIHERALGRRDDRLRDPLRRAFGMDAFAGP
jgi:hypothetical protein